MTDFDFEAVKAALARAPERDRRRCGALYQATREARALAVKLEAALRAELAYLTADAERVVERPPASGTLPSRGA
jgi:hypothetical protein